ncbi:MAG: DUF131 domain-containing protein, partial [Candidatus Bathyarchaeia archaeon]
MDNINIFTLGFILTLIGLGIIIASFLLYIKKTKPKINGGGVIFIGPIPLVFTTNKVIGKTLILITLLIILVMIF